MSSTLTLNQMVTEIQTRIPMGLQPPYIIGVLNESFRWIAQQDSFMWNLRRTTVTVAAATVDFSLPAAADPGDAMSLYGTNYEYEIPFIPFEKFSQQQVFNQPPPSGTFSAWTIMNNGSGYIGKLAPDTALGAPVTLNLFYHTTVVAVNNGANYFPSPDEFDNLILDLTEATIKRRYNLVGWQEAQGVAMEETKKLIDSYRSSKRFIQGLAEQAMNAQEAQVKRAE